MHKQCALEERVVSGSYDVEKMPRILRVCEVTAVTVEYTEAAGALYVLIIRPTAVDDGPTDNIIIL